MPSSRVLWPLALFLTGALASAAGGQDVPIDDSKYARACGVIVRHAEHRLMVRWPMTRDEYGHVDFDLRCGQPLIDTLGIAPNVFGKEVPLLRGVDPMTCITVGTRQAPQGRPPEMSIWNTFFDKPASRPHQTYLARLDLKRVRVTSTGSRASVIIGDVTAGPFRGELVFTFYLDSRLVHVETVVAADEDRRAILYDAGLVGKSEDWQSLQQYEGPNNLRFGYRISGGEKAFAVRNRMLVVECKNGSVACFPPPHQFHCPRDWTDNLKFVWAGTKHHGFDLPAGFGVHQVADGGRAFEPWFNAPPRSKQRLGVFYLLSRKDAGAEALRYTHGDRFPKLPGHITFTSHWHMAVAVSAMERKTPEIPSFVRVFKDMGVNAVHLADFHGDGHQKDPGPLRLPELEMLFRECGRLSDDRLLLIPGEEVNDFLGIKEKGKHPGHWMSLFPKPVYWVQQRTPGQPFADTHPRYGRFYRVGRREDMVALLKQEHGLAWSAHPRIKASSWTPDIFRNEDFYKADFWLGAAWKAMPADLSRPRLGERALDLLDDMANWGPKKYLPGEVDVFKIDPTHELYGHMNVNYIRLPKLPRYEQGWQSILDALRAGQFFVTTGEVLIHDFTAGGKQSGEALTLGADGRPELRLTLEWTFPLRFAEIISGDGHKVYRHTLDLADTGPFGKRTWTLRPDLRGRKWVRLEVWDVATNGAYTQPIWLE